MQPLPSSYRDNDGFVFEHEGKIFRFIHPQYEEHYQLLMASGLYNALVKKGLLVSHQEFSSLTSFDLPPGRVILPEQISFNTILFCKEAMAICNVSSAASCHISKHHS